MLKELLSSSSISNERIVSKMLFFESNCWILDTKMFLKTFVNTSQIRLDSDKIIISF